MIRINKRLFLLFTIIIVIFCPTVLAEELNIDTNYSRVADIYFNFVMKKDFINAAKTFHYPPYYSKEKLQRDINGVKRVLEHFNQEFGRVMSYTSEEGKTKMSGVYVFGGDTSYWEKRSQVHKETYCVQFEKEGKGYISFLFCNIINKIQIRQVTYSFEDTKPHLKERLAEVYKGMQKIYDEFK